MDTPSLFCVKYLTKITRFKTGIIITKNAEKSFYKMIFVEVLPHAHGNSREFLVHLQFWAKYLEQNGEIQ